MTPIALGVAMGALALLAPTLLTRAASALRLAGGLRVRRREREQDLTRAAAYHRQLPATDRADSLHDRTWSDLDLDDVFRTLDQTSSEPGRQYLYHRLRTPHASTESLHRFERVVQRFAGDAALADAAREALGRLADRRASYVVDLVFEELPARPRLWWLMPLLTASAVGCVALGSVWPKLYLLWLAVCAVNIAVQLTYKPLVKRFIPAIHEMPAFLRVAESLSALPFDEVAGERQTLRDGARRFGALRRAATWLTFEPGQGNELASSVYEYVNLLFLIDVNAFVFSTETIRGHRDVLRSMFEAIGYLDAAHSVAAWRGTLATWAVPDLTTAPKTLDVERLVHPLVATPVPNDLRIDRASVLITGSNMSGKTTFVRALGVSAVLAQTLHTVCAAAWRSSPLVVRTSIGRDDSVLEGKSYYLAEVETVGALVRASGSERPHLFLLDEIFRGTNTTERVAAAYAVLAHLDRVHDLVLVATHDLELLALLGDRYASHHFREEVADDGLTFDYRIRPGPSSTRNAIALLRVMRYPDTVVADALAVVDRTTGPG